MKPGNKNSYKSLKSININGKDYMYYSSNESGSIYSTMYKMSLNSNLGKGSPMTKNTGTNITIP